MDQSVLVQNTHHIPLFLVALSQIFDVDLVLNELDVGLVEEAEEFHFEVRLVELSNVSFLLC